MKLILSKYTKLNYVLTQIYIGLLVFLLYSFVFGLRKSFSIGTYNSFQLWGIDFKVLNSIYQFD